MKILFIILIIYLLLVLAGKYLFPYILRYYVKRFSRKFYNGMEHFNQGNPYKKEGEIHIDNPDKNKSHTSDVGEYVDFEEIK